MVRVRLLDGETVTQGALGGSEPRAGSSDRAWKTFNGVGDAEERTLGVLKGSAESKIKKKQLKR